jgi:hypothetical protein
MAGSWVFFYGLNVPQLSAESALAHFEFKVRQCFEFKNSASIYAVQIFIIKLF